MSATNKTTATLFLFFILTLIVLSIESCSESWQRRRDAEREYRNQLSPQGSK